MIHVLRLIAEIIGWIAIYLGTILVTLCIYQSHQFRRFEKRKE